MNKKMLTIGLSTFIGIAMNLHAEVVEKSMATAVEDVICVEPGQSSSPYGYVLKMNLKGQKKVPLLISLHGAGGGKNGVKGMTLGEEQSLSETEFSYVFLKPVCQGRWTAEELDKMIESIKMDYAESIDSNRIYIYGQSMGGYGSWLYCISHGNKIAAMMSSEGGFIQNTGPVSKYNFEHFKTLPVWVFHNKDDKTVPLNFAMELVDSAKAVGGEPKLSLFDTGGHKSRVPDMMKKEVLE